MLYKLWYQSVKQNLTNALPIFWKHNLTGAVNTYRCVMFTLTLEPYTDFHYLLFKIAKT